MSLISSAFSPSIDKKNKAADPSTENTESRQREKEIQK
jgi:hypothetical protein